MLWLVAGLHPVAQLPPCQCSLAPSPHLPLPVLPAPPSQINTSNLERVRRIKNRMVRLTTRVETVRA